MQTIHNRLHTTINICNEEKLVPHQLRRLVPHQV